MKSQISFGVSIEVDQATGEVQTAYFRVRKGKTAETREFENGNLFADYDNAGNLLGVEMLAPCNVSVFERLSEPEPAVKKFLLRSTPNHMVLAGRRIGKSATATAT